MQILSDIRGFRVWGTRLCPTKSGQYLGVNISDFVGVGFLYDFTAQGSYFSPQEIRKTREKMGKKPKKIISGKNKNLKGVPF